MFGFKKRHDKKNNGYHNEKRYVNEQKVILQRKRLKEVGIVQKASALAVHEEIKIVEEVVF